MDDPHYFQRDDLALALNTRGESNQFTFLMAHSPEILEEARKAEVDFYICGHTHGGQVCLPVFGMIHWNARCAKKYAKGEFNYKGMKGYTHQGTGSSNSPIRFNCLPEIVIHKLKRAI